MMLTSVLKETLLLMNFYLAGDKYKGKTKDHLRNLRDHIEAVLEALEDEHVPLDNGSRHNLAEGEGSQG
jgi:hypothetical protein